MGVWRVGYGLTYKSTEDCPNLPVQLMIRDVRDGCRGSSLARLELPCYAWASFSDDFVGHGRNQCHSPIMTGELLSDCSFYPGPI